MPSCSGGLLRRCSCGCWLVIAESGKAQSGWRAEKTGQSYFRKAGVEHDVRNETSREIVSVATEIKR